MRIVVISDTHSNKLSDLLPDGDILIHAGDFSNSGSVLEVTKFNEECGKILHKYTFGIYVCPGNHDFLAERSQNLCRDILSNANLMIDESLVISGIKFYFSPWQPEYFDWAFNLPRAGYELEEVWSRIPEDTDILITHTPAFGRLDYVPRGSHVGCSALRNRIDSLRNLKIHCFGHVHFGYGYQYFNNKLYINAAICSEWNGILNQPIVVDFDEVTKQFDIVRDVYVP